VQSVLDDPDKADITAKHRAMLRFIDKLTRTPNDVVAADALAVLDAGVSEQAFRDALYVQGMFAFITRCADAFAFEIPPEEGFRVAGKSLLRFGYKL